MKYFAYGSNMYWKQMNSRCPSATFHIIAVLPDHRLAFSRYSKTRGCGVADVVFCQGSSVWGVVYEISDDDMCKLDRDEGYKPGREINSYTRVERTVFGEAENGSPIQVVTYVAVPQPNAPLPDSKYLSLILDGARYWKLPGHYIDLLKKVETSENEDPE